MTGLLKEVLSQHAETTVPVDIEAVMADGRRRVRRRRIGAAALGTAATVAAIAVGQVLPGSAPEQTQVTSASPWRAASYAYESTIFLDGRAIKAGKPVRSYVPTDDGMVFADDTGTIWFTDGDEANQIGKTSKQGLYLAHDDAGSLAGWVDFSAEIPEFVVYDTSVGGEVLRTNEGNVAGMTSFLDARNPAHLYAIDEGVAYWRSTDGLVAFDIAAGTSQVIDPDARPFDLQDVAGGVFAFARGGTITVGDGPTDTVPMPGGYSAVLSPDGAYVATDDADVMRVFESATGAEVTPTPEGYGFLVAYQWEDADTVAVAGIRDLDEDSMVAEFEFMTCDIGGQCEVFDTATLEYDKTSLPLGEEIQ